MLTITFAAAKGGSGKTTLSAHVACLAAASGLTVTMLDTDPQGSLIRWWQARKADTPAMGTTTVAGFKAWLATQEKAGTDLVIVDTPPTISRDMGVYITASDLICIPTRPSPHDLHSVQSTIDVCEKAGRPMAFLINGAAHRARITADAIQQLSQHGPVGPTVHQRTDFATSMIDGRTVQDIDPRSRSAAEVTALWTYIHHRATKLAAKPATMHARKIRS